VKVAGFLGSSGFTFFGPFFFQGGLEVNADIFRDRFFSPFAADFHRFVEGIEHNPAIGAVGEMGLEFFAELFLKVAVDII
jgi:hypothetical protein